VKIVAGVPLALKTLPLHRRHIFCSSEAEMTKTVSKRSSNVTPAISTKRLKLEQLVPTLKSAWSWRSNELTSGFERLERSPPWLHRFGE